MRQKQCILLLGSTGYLGQTLMGHLQPRGYVVPTHRSKARFADSCHYDFWTDNVHVLIKRYQIDTVIIAASMAYEAAHPDCERALFKRQAERLIRECQQCRVIYISSDGIFDGRRGHYTECDLPTPLTLYGENLQYLEEKVQNLCSNYCIIRPSYLYGYSLSQLDARLSRVQDRLLAGEKRTFFTDMIKSPMEVNQAAEAITLLTYSRHIGIVHVAGEAMSVYDFYQEAMRSLGVALEPLYAAQMPTDFPHPRDTSLDIHLMKHLTKIEPIPVHFALLKER